MKNTAKNLANSYFTAICILLLLVTAPVQASWIQRLSTVATRYKKNVCDYWTSFKASRMWKNSHIRGLMNIEEEAPQDASHLAELRERTQKFWAFLDAIPSSRYKVNQKYLLDRIIRSLHLKKPYKAQTYAYLMRFLSKKTNDQLFEILKQGKSLNLNPAIKIRPRYSFDARLRQRYEFMNAAQDTVQRVQQLPQIELDTPEFNEALNKAWLKELTQGSFKTLATSRILDDNHTGSPALDDLKYQWKLELFKQKFTQQWITHKQQLADYEQQYTDDIEAYNTVFNIALDRKFYEQNYSSRVMEAE